MEHKEMTTHIVHIEDEPGVLELVHLILSHRSDIELSQATTGLAGVDLIRREKPDLVLLDMMLRDIDGRDVCRHLQADDSLKSIPILIVTARPNIASELRAAPIPGVAGFLVKPFSPLDLFHSIDEILKGAC
jgi:DNA-binding response OmpR family regulator